MSASQTVEVFLGAPGDGKVIGTVTVASDSDVPRRGSNTHGLDRLNQTVPGVGTAAAPGRPPELFGNGIED